MGEKFFALVRWIGLSVATVALLAVVGSGLSVFLKYVESVNDEVEAPKVAFADFAAFKNRTFEQTTDVTAADDMELKEEREEFQTKFLENYKVIFKNLKEYTRYVNQPEVDERGLEEYLFKLISKYDYSLRIAYMEQLSAETTEFVAYGEESRADVTKKIIEWTAFLDWFSNDFEAQLHAEEKRVEAGKVTALEEAFYLYKTSSAVGITFVVFMFFIIILFLFNIERNTRKEQVVSEEQDETEEK